MIYDESIFNKELKESYFERSISMRKRFEYSLFIALISFAIYFIMQTLDKSVLIDAVPKYMSQSSFSTLMIYKDVFYITYIIYLAINYHFLTFDEIRNNKWYIPFKFGFSPNKMIFTKLLARLLTIFFVYGMGYLVTLFFTSILKYQFVFEYILPIFIIGLIDINFIIIVTMTSSLYYKKGILSNYAIFFSVFLTSALKYLLGYINVVNNINNFYSLNVLSQLSKYMSSIFIISVACVIIIFFKGKLSSKYFFFSSGKLDYDFSDDVTITILSDSKFKVINSKLNKEESLKVITKILNAILIAVITVSIVLNILVLLITISTASKEISIFNIIPYVFQSDTMNPAIKYNDLVFFKKNANSELLIGDIVIYEANKEVNIARIKSFQAEKTVVDIDNYPYQSKTVTYREPINKSQIYGKYIGRSRWLGLLVLFANSTIGRLLLLLIPIILLFYYKPIIALLRFIFNNSTKE